MSSLQSAANHKYIHIEHIYPSTDNVLYARRPDLYEERCWMLPISLTF